MHQKWDVSSEKSLTNSRQAFVSEEYISSLFLMKFFSLVAGVGGVTITVIDLLD